MNKKNKIVIIGGGPAGMISAGTAAANGASVLLLEKNEKLGKKLLITGKERCNITNAGLNKNNLVKIYGKNGRFLHSAFFNFSNDDVIEFFENLGVLTKVEDDNRVFPKSDRAIDVLFALENYLKTNKVKIKYNTDVKKIAKKGKLITKVVLTSGKEISGDKFIITTGGKSYPETGSTGDAYTWLTDLGHRINNPLPALVPMQMSDGFIKYLEGLSLCDIKISLIDDNKIIVSSLDDAIFTANGMSGPAIINISKLVHNLKKPKISIDFIPTLTFDQLDKKVQSIFDVARNKMIRNVFDGFLPSKLVPTMLNICKIKPEKQSNGISRAERQRLVRLIKDFQLHISKLEGFDKAVITTGGVNLKEVDPKTMQSKLYKNLYFAGEVLDLDGPTGGYNLQICWSTGFTAGSNVL